MDFPPHSNPKCAIKLSKLYKTHVLTSITCCKCEIPFPPKVEDQMDCKQLLPHNMCKWHFNVKTSSKSSLQCVTVIPMVSPLTSKIMQKLATHVTLVNFLRVLS